MLIKYEMINDFFQRLNIWTMTSTEFNNTNNEYHCIVFLNNLSAMNFCEL